jgi:predicted hydrocarbon binding protein
MPKKDSVGNSILDEMAFIKENGLLSFKGVRYLLIRPETLAGIYRALEKTHGARTGADTFFRGGFEGGRLSAEKFRRPAPGWEKEIVEFMTRMGCEIGWGRFRILKLDLERKVLRLSLSFSPFAAAYGRSRHPVCDLPRGVFAGVAAGIFGTGVLATETQCKAMGARVCKFEITGASDRHRGTRKK